MIPGRCSRSPKSFHIKAVGDMHYLAGGDVVVRDKRSFDFLAWRYNGRRGLIVPPIVPYLPRQAVGPWQWARMMPGMDPDPYASQGGTKQAGQARRHEMGVNNIDPLSPTVPSNFPKCSGEASLACIWNMDKGNAIKAQIR